MITVFEFFMLLKTKQRIKFIRTTKDGKQMTVTGEAFRVMNTLMDVKCEMEYLDSIEIKNNEIVLTVKNAPKEIENLEDEE